MNSKSDVFASLALAGLPISNRMGSFENLLNAYDRALYLAKSSDLNQMLHSDLSPEDFKPRALVAV